MAVTKASFKVAAGIAAAMPFAAWAERKAPDGRGGETVADPAPSPHQALAPVFSAPRSE